MRHTHEGSEAARIPADGLTQGNGGHSARPAPCKNTHTASAEVKHRSDTDS